MSIADNSGLVHGCLRNIRRDNPAYSNRGHLCQRMNVMNSDYISIEDITEQYVDFLNIKYVNMNKEKRLKNLSSIAKRIAKFRYDNDHMEIKEVVTDVAREHRCEHGAV